MLKVYKGGFGYHETYVGAEAESEAIQKISDKLSIPHLPVTAEEVIVDGYVVQLVPIGKKGGEVSGEDNKGNANEGKSRTAGQGSNKPGGRKD